MCPQPPWWSAILVGGALAAGGYFTGNRFLWYGAVGLPAAMLVSSLVCSSREPEQRFVTSPVHGGKATAEIRERIEARTGVKGRFGI